MRMGYSNYTCRAEQEIRKQFGTECDNLKMDFRTEAKLYKIYRKKGNGIQEPRTSEIN
jgi:hypothetical protein